MNRREELLRLMCAMIGAGTTLTREQVVAHARWQVHVLDQVEPARAEPECVAPRVEVTQRAPFVIVRMMPRARKRQKRKTGAHRKASARRNQRKRGKHGG